MLGLTMHNIIFFNKAYLPTILRVLQ